MIETIVNHETGADVRAKLNELILSTPSVLFSNSATSLVTNTTTPTSVVPAGHGSNVIAANTLVAGSIIRLTSWGYGESDAALGGGFNEYLEFAGLSFFQGGFLDLSAVNAYWRFEGEVTILTIGATGTCLARVRLINFDGVGVWTDYMNGSNTGGPSTIDTTANMTIDQKHEWLVASTDNNWITQHLRVEVSRAS